MKISYVTIKLIHILNVCDTNPAPSLEGLHYRTSVLLRDVPAVNRKVSPHPNIKYDLDLHMMRRGASTRTVLLRTF